MKNLLLAICLYIPACCFAQVEPEQVLRKMSATLEGHKSIGYTAITRMKFFDGDDTSSFPSTVYLAREKDSIFGGNIRYAINDTIYKFYDLQKIYSVSTNQKKVMTFDPHQGEQWGMTGNTTFNIILKGFLKPEKLIESIESAQDIQLLSDTNFNGHECYRVQLQHPDEDDLTNWISIYHIGKKDHIPYFSCRSVLYQGNYEYRDFTILSYTFDNVPASRFSAKQIPSDYTIEAYKRKEEDDKLLNNGAVAPIINGKHYQHNLKEETLDYKGKITVLDFWYMACHPCIQAIPEMEKLREKYKGNPRVQIIGVNSSDADTGRIKKLPQFLEHNHIGYSFFLVDKKIPGDFKVRAWPSFYIIGPDGKVAYSEIGFDPEKLYTNLSGKIDELLK